MLLLMVVQHVFIIYPLLFFFLFLHFFSLKNSVNRAGARILPLLSMPHAFWELQHPRSRDHLPSNTTDFPLDPPSVNMAQVGATHWARTSSQMI